MQLFHHDLENYLDGHEYIIPKHVLDRAATKVTELEKTIEILEKKYQTLSAEKPTFHEYLSQEYWADYVEGHQYICPNYRFERMMSEVEKLKHGLTVARDWIIRIAFNGSAHLSQGLREDARVVLKEISEGVVE